MKRMFAWVLCLVMCLSLTACFKKPTVESFVAQIEADLEAAHDAGTLDVLARENSLVYSYQYKVDLQLDKATMATVLEQATAESEITYTGMLAQLKAAVPDAQAVIVEFLDKNGEVIYTKTYQ